MREYELQKTIIALRETTSSLSTPIRDVEIDRKFSQLFTDFRLNAWLDNFDRSHQTAASNGRSPTDQYFQSPSQGNSADRSAIQGDEEGDETHVSTSETNAQQPAASSAIRAGAQKPAARSAIRADAQKLAVHSAIRADAQKPAVHSAIRANAQKLAVHSAIDHDEADSTAILADKRTTDPSLAAPAKRRRLESSQPGSSSEDQLISNIGSETEPVSSLTGISSSLSVGTFSSSSEASQKTMLNIGGKELQLCIKVQEANSNKAVLHDISWLEPDYASKLELAAKGMFRDGQRKKSLNNHRPWMKLTKEACYNVSVLRKKGASPWLEGKVRTAACTDCKSKSAPKPCIIVERDDSGNCVLVVLPLSQLLNDWNTHGTWVHQKGCAIEL
jgi:hypothetical protein